MEILTIIVPCYNEELALPIFYETIKKVLDSINHLVRYELLLINDGSNDHTLKIMKQLSKEDGNVRYISFSRNFGKEAAMLSGFQHSNGDYVVIMDADLQDPPALIPEMLRFIQEEGYDSVATRRVTRKGEPIIRSFFARQFYKLINRISDANIVDGARDYRMMNRAMVDAVLSMSEYNRFSKGIFGWVGFDTKWLEYKNVERVAGETKWSIWKLFKYSLEGITAFSVIPLQIASVFGILLFFLASIMIVFVIIRTSIYGDPVGGWPSLVCIIMLLGGIQLLSIGILGQYLSKTYLETKNRPIYIIKDTNID